MKMLLINFVLLALVVGNAYDINHRNGTKLAIMTTDDSDDHHKKDAVLSRRKRFIVFPDGSSFQLVFCTQNQGYLQIGDIVWFGNTAALAWELPTDPTVFNMFKEKSRLYESSNRRSDNKHIYYLNEEGKVIGKEAYHKKPIVNPAFAKRSVDHLKPQLYVKKMHAAQKNTNYLDALPQTSVEFHRSARKSLYGRVEKVLQALGWNGTECVLRMLCESKKPKNKQGTFVEEIMRITFTLPKGPEFEADRHKRYDIAHGSVGECSALYPACEDLHGLPLFQ